jgi:hypothetical protein
LRDEIRPNTTLTNQSLSVKISAALTTIIFVAGLINSILAVLTFRSAQLRKVGCGIYLLASSINSICTISMFLVKFWFLVLTEMNVSTRRSILRGGCVSIESLLKLFLYLDAWLNACVAAERAVLVVKGTGFNKEKSKRSARWIIGILAFCIMSSIIHEPLYRKLFEVKTDEDKTETHVWCITRYSPYVQNYNTVILFFHLIAPFIVNLVSALFIIFGSARQRSAVRTRQTYREHIYEQFREHKQLLISPIILLMLSLPRLIISLLPGCVNASRYPWVFLIGYFISFIPSMLIFPIFVLPSQLYRKTFQDSLKTWRRQIYQ